MSITRGADDTGGYDLCLLLYFWISSEKISKLASFQNQFIILLFAIQTDDLV